MKHVCAQNRGRVVLILLGIVIVALVAVFAFFAWAVGVNNRIVRRNQAADAAWAQVQNVYQRRLDLIPNLVATVKGAAAHELDVQVGVVRERAKATQVNINPTDPEQFKTFASSQAALGGALGRLLAVAENYPQIRANENFLTLQAQLEGTENRISVERGKFNEAVMAYNSEILVFPGALVASFRNFRARPYFTGEAEAQKAPKVEFEAPKANSGASQLLPEASPATTGSRTWLVQPPFRKQMA